MHTIMSAYDVTVIVTNHKNVSVLPEVKWNLALYALMFGNLTQDALVK